MKDIKIQTNLLLDGWWEAIDENTYDVDSVNGTYYVCSPIGSGLTRHEAIQDLLEQTWEYYSE